MSSNNIALRISGTKIRKGGFAPLVAVGILPPTEEHNLDRSLQIAENTGVIFKHTRDYIIYNLVDCRVRPVDDDAPGRMSIAISIPWDMQLANNVSPYELLNKIYREFTSRYMLPLSDGRNVFDNKEIDSGLFRSILEQYSIENRKSSYVQMNPAGTSARIAISPDKITEFFRDTQYPEFAQFKEIEVGTTGSSSAQLEGLQIPRPVVYTIMVNGRQLTTTADIRRPIPLSAIPTLYDEFEPYTLVIKELLDNGGLLERNGTTIRLNPQTATIDCKLHSNPITYHVRIDWKSGEAIRQYLENGNIKITQGHIDYTRKLIDGKCTVAANCASKEFRISESRYKGNNLRIVQNVDCDKREITLKLIVTPEDNNVARDNIGYQKSLNGNSFNGGNRGHGGNGGRGNIGGGSIPSNDDSNYNYNNDIKNNVSKPDNDLAKAFFFGILIGFIIGIVGFYTIYEFMLKDKKQETEQLQNSDNGTIDDSSNIAENISNSVIIESDIAKEEQQPSETTTVIIANLPTRPNGDNIPTLDKLKEQLVNEYNNNQWIKCKNIIAKNYGLRQYSDDLDKIFKIRQNKAYIDNEGLTHELDDGKITLLINAGYISTENKPTDKFKINTLDDISPLLENINQTLGSF